MQAKSPIDGVRYTKWAVVRDTYRNLRKTTIPSWHEWVNPDIGKWSALEPSTHCFQFALLDGSVVDTIVEFIALGDRNIEDVMRGWEGTGIMFDEMDRLLVDALYFALSRVGRYPSKANGSATWSGVWGVWNAADDDNWTTDKFIYNLPEGWAFFRQPGGLDPKAENIDNLPKDYYQKMMLGQEDWFIRRMIHNQIGYSRDGQPVFPEFRDDFHVAASELFPVKELPLVIGLDAGRTPAASIDQVMPDGQWLGLDELVTENMGAVRFGEELNRLLATEKYRGMRAVCWADPSAIFKGQNDENSWVDTVRSVTGLTVRPAPGNNNLTPRLDAVRLPLTRLIDGRPGYLLSPTCKVRRKAMNSGYRYKRVAVQGGVRFEDKPDKNESSHVMDAEQYGKLGGGEYIEVMGRKQSSLAGKTFTANTSFKVI
jgi:hypothetical protein